MKKRLHLYILALILCLVFLLVGAGVIFLRSQSFHAVPQSEPEQSVSGGAVGESSEQRQYFDALKNEICQEPDEPILLNPYDEEPIYAEFGTDEYIVHDNCLYFGGKPVYARNLYNLIVSGEFGELPSVMSREDYFGENPVHELFRYEHDGKLRIFLGGSVDCGGCLLAGPFLEINKATGEIEGKVAELPYFLNLKQSPNKKLAVLVEFTYPEQGEDGVATEGVMTEEHYLYDLVNFEKIQKLYAPTPGKNTLLSCGMGCWFDGVDWLDDRFVRMTPRTLTERDRPYIWVSDEESVYEESFVVSVF